jgi:oligoribonuclease NrnB/cAMP/cGMP phosphodiesterase (DHH superfamily)
MNDKLLCLYHAACVDGFTAAWVVHSRYPDAEFIPVSYDDAVIPDVRDRDVLIVDFSYKADVMRVLVEQSSRLLVLDHHASAERELAFMNATLAKTYFDFIIGEYAHAAVFDKERSGAALAWDYCRTGLMRPPLVEFVQDRDLWRFQLRGTKEVHAYLTSYEMTFDRWDKINTELLEVGGWDRITDEGGAILRVHQKLVREAVAATKRVMMIGGQPTLVANVPYNYASDAGHILAQGVPFAATYVDTPKGRAFSLQSSPEGIDVSKIAESYGGGGHFHAAGFVRGLGWPGDIPV